MADITIVQEHQLSPQNARAAAEQVAQKLAADFDLSYQWEGDVLNFERGGVNGTLRLAPNQAEMVIKLGFLFGAFAPVIQAKAAEKMARVFAAA